MTTHGSIYIDDGAEDEERERRMSQKFVALGKPDGMGVGGLKKYDKLQAFIRKCSRVAAGKHLPRRLRARYAVMQVHQIAEVPAYDATMPYGATPGYVAQAEDRILRQQPRIPCEHIQMVALAPEPGMSSVELHQAILIQNMPKPGPLYIESTPRPTVAEVLAEIKPAPLDIIPVKPKSTPPCFICGQYDCTCHFGPEHFDEDIAP